MRRFVFAPRWMVGHALVVTAVVCCVLLGRWQLGRAEITHSLQNMAYALQWPLFAVFFAVMWLRMLRLESRRLDEDDAEQAAHDASAAPAAAAKSPAGPAAPATSPAEPATTPAHPVTGSAEPMISPEEPVTGPGEPAADDEDDPELAAYNRMLAELAARDRAESARRR